MWVMGAGVGRGRVYRYGGGLPRSVSCSWDRCATSTGVCNTNGAQGSWLRSRYWWHELPVLESGLVMRWCRCKREADGQ